MPQKRATSGRRFRDSEAHTIRFKDATFSLCCSRHDGMRTLPLLTPHTPHFRANVDPNLSCRGCCGRGIRRSDGP